MKKPKIQEIYQYLTFGLWDNDNVGYFKPERYHGFVYLIYDHNDCEIYIGKKTFNEGWKTYTSSSVALNQKMIEYGMDDFEFVIVSLHEDEESLKMSERQEINRAKRLYEGQILNIN